MLLAPGVLSVRYGVDEPGRTVGSSVRDEVRESMGDHVRVPAVVAARGAALRDAPGVAPADPTASARERDVAVPGMDEGAPDDQPLPVERGAISREDAFGR